MLNDLITYVSIGLALWMAWRYLRRSVRYVWEKVMSWQGSAGPVLPADRAGSEPIKTRPVMPVLPQQNQAQQTTFDEVMAFFARHNLSDEEAIKLLSILRRNGDHLISANKIRDIVGGADQVVKAQVAALRPKPPAKLTQGRQERPVNGW